MKCLITLSLILFTIAYSNAQEKEYVVRKTNDTIYGKLTRESNILNPSIIYFKIKDELGNKHLLKPSEVKTIRSLNGVDGNCIIKTVYDKFFIKKIVAGRIEVFQMLDNAIFYISKDNIEIKSVDFGGFESRKKSHAQIRPLIINNSEILKEFDTLKGSEKNILYIIKKYNSHYIDQYPKDSINN